jgi:DNA-binding HxlR family transcriptional regulator
MSEQTPRSDCPINYLTEIIGDKWSLLIIRDMLMEGKSTYSEFLASDERISTNILATRLRTLEEANLIRRIQDPEHRSRHTYTLTERAIDLAPLLVEMVLWTIKYHSIPADRQEFANRALQDKELFTREIQNHARRGESVHNLVVA